MPLQNNREIVGFISDSSDNIVYLFAFYSDGSVYRVKFEIQTDRCEYKLLSYEESQIYSRIRKARLIFNSTHDNVWVIEEGEVYFIDISAQGNLSKSESLFNIEVINEIDGVERIEVNEIEDITSSPLSKHAFLYFIKTTRYSMTIVVDKDKYESYSKTELANDRDIISFYHRLTLNNGLLSVKNVFNGIKSFAVDRVKDVVNDMDNQIFYIISLDDEIFVVNHNIDQDGRDIAKLETEIENPQFSVPNMYMFNKGLGLKAAKK